MSEDVSRRRALSLLGAALGLALTRTEDEAEAETTGTKSRHTMRTSRHQRPTVQPATAPAEAATPEFKPTRSQSELLMAPVGPRPPLHIGE